MKRARLALAAVTLSLLAAGQTPAHAVTAPNPGIDSGRADGADRGFMACVSTQDGVSDYCFVATRRRNSTDVTATLASPGRTIHETVKAGPAAIQMVTDPAGRPAARLYLQMPRLGPVDVVSTTALAATISYGNATCLGYAIRFELVARPAAIYLERRTTGSVNGVSVSSNLGCGTYFDGPTSGPWIFTYSRES